MIKKVKIEEALGKPLLHDITGIFPGGFKGVMFERGHIIGQEDIDKLKDIGKNHVYVGDLGPGLVHEEDAALDLAKEVCGPGTYFTKPREGKIDIKAQSKGLLKINIGGLNAINSLGDYTIATVYNNNRQDIDDKLAGLRIVPLWTDQALVDRAIDLARKHFPIFEIRPFERLKVGTIITGSEIYYGRVKDAFEPVLRRKFSYFDTDILGFVKCPDDKSYIKEAMEEFLAQDVDLIVFTGGMSVDPDDLTPSVIKEASDRFIIQGVPIQPGNMLTLAMKGQTYLLGVPGASMHAQITSLDMVLPRIYAKEYLKREDFTVLGEGGLY